MTSGQYESAQTIMQLSRIFAKAMRDCMENSGLMQDGYQLSVNIWQPYDGGEVVLLNSIRLDKMGVETREELDATSFTNHYYEKEGWVVVSDPIIKSGAVPPTVRTAETAQRIYSCRKEEAKPVAPDGLWLSYRDNCDPVDGGM